MVIQTYLEQLSHLPFPQHITRSSPVQRSLGNTVLLPSVQDHKSSTVFLGRRRRQCCLPRNAVHQEERTSLIPATLRELEGALELQEVGQGAREKPQVQLTREERKARQRTLDELGAPPFHSVLQVALGACLLRRLHVPHVVKPQLRACVAAWQEHGVAPLQRGPATTLQLNIGLYCNQACSHCHVESSPLRTEAMDRRTAERCLQLLAGSGSVRTLDLTGGAPELNAQFRLVASCQTEGGTDGAMCSPRRMRHGLRQRASAACPSHVVINRLLHARAAQPLPGPLHSLVYSRHGACTDVSAKEER